MNMTGLFQIHEKSTVEAYRRGRRRTDEENRVHAILYLRVNQRTRRPLDLLTMPLVWMQVGVESVFWQWVIARMRKFENIIYRANSVGMKESTKNTRGMTKMAQGNESYDGLGMNSQIFKLPPLGVYLKINVTPTVRPNFSFFFFCFRKILQTCLSNFCLFQFFFYLRNNLRYNYVRWVGWLDFPLIWSF